MACKCGTFGCVGPANKDWIDQCIAGEGWAGMGVMAGDGDPSFNYTIGLADRGLPELIIFGLPSQFGHSILSSAIEHLDKLRDGAVLDEIATLPVAVRAVPAGPANERFVVQACHYHGREVEVLQLVWPDAKGLFPWQPGCAERMVKLQDALVDFSAEQGAAPVPDGQPNVPAGRYLN